MGNKFLILKQQARILSPTDGQLVLSLKESTPNLHLSPDEGDRSIESVHQIPTPRGTKELSKGEDLHEAGMADEKIAEQLSEKETTVGAIIWKWMAHEMTFNLPPRPGAPRKISPRGGVKVRGQLGTTQEELLNDLKAAGTKPLETHYAVEVSNPAALAGSPCSRRYTTKTYITKFSFILGVSQLETIIAHLFLW